MKNVLLKYWEQRRAPFKSFPPNCTVICTCFLRIFFIEHLLRIKILASCFRLKKKYSEIQLAWMAQENKKRHKSLWRNDTRGADAHGKNMKNARKYFKGKLFGTDANLREYYFHFFILCLWLSKVIFSLEINTTSLSSVHASKSTFRTRQLAQ